MDTHTNARTTLQALLDGLGTWTFQTARIPSRQDGSKWDKQALHFHVSIVAPNGATWSGNYSVGSMVPSMEAARIAENPAKDDWRALRLHLLRAGAGGIALGPSAKDVRELNGLRKRDSVDRRALRDAVDKAYAPNLLDVLSSLSIDASSFPCSFREWCAEWGTDGPGGNPADALESYQACERAYAFMVKALGTGDGGKLEAFQEMAWEL